MWKTFNYDDADGRMMADHDYNGGQTDRSLSENIVDLAETGESCSVLVSSICLESGELVDDDGVNGDDQLTVGNDDDG